MILSPESTSKVESCIKSSRSIFKQIFIDDTVAGLRKFCLGDSHAENLGDDDIFVTNCEVSLDCTAVSMTLRKMLKHLKCEDLVIAMCTTCKTYFDGYPVHVLGCID